ncbi:MAG: septation protein SepH [Marmoricola sp.]
MRDLTPLRLTGGGTLLVLGDADGVEYVVPVDVRLRETLGQSISGAVESPKNPAAQPLGVKRLESSMESSLRPRDIQARIRAGESPEDVAAVAGTPVERVMIFAAPVLAERAHVAQGAQTASVRRRSADPLSTVRTLGPAAATRLREEGVDPESVEWDAWRREDGRWTLVAAYHHDGEGRRAGFSFDQPGHFVVADDDEGRWLVGDGQFPTRAVKDEARRLDRAPVPRYEEQLPLGDDAIELVREEVPTHPSVPEPGRATGDADWIAAPRRSSPAAVPADPRPTREPHLTRVEHTPEPATDDPDAEQDVLPGFDHASPAEDDAAAENASSDRARSTDESDDPETQLPRRAARKARGRSSVPSWDEIMFGGGRGD